MVAARKLLRRAGRDRAGRFLVEGAQAVREALATASVRDLAVHELFVTATAADRHPELVATARGGWVRISPVTDRAAETLSDTVTRRQTGTVEIAPADVKRVKRLLGR